MGRNRPFAKTENCCAESGMRGKSRCGECGAWFIKHPRLGIPRPDVGERNFKHGFRDHRLYHAWDNMMQRCYNVNHPQSYYWGGRGIVVCERWHDIANFVEDMESSFIEGLSLDRYPDQNGNYEPSNVRWATPEESGQNVACSICRQSGHNARSHR